MGRAKATKAAPNASQQRTSGNEKHEPANKADTKTEKQKKRSRPPKRASGSKHAF